MGFINKVPANPHGGPYRGCPKPDSNGRKNFEIGTLWECDICHKTWRFKEAKSDQREGNWDVWEEVKDLGPYVKPATKWQPGPHISQTDCF